MDLCLWPRPLDTCIFILLTTTNNLVHSSNQNTLFYPRHSKGGLILNLKLVRKHEVSHGASHMGRVKRRLWEMPRNKYTQPATDSGNRNTRFIFELSIRKKESYFQLASLLFWQGLQTNLFEQNKFSRPTFYFAKRPIAYGHRRTRQRQNRTRIDRL